MRRLLFLLLTIPGLVAGAASATKPHVCTFGKTTSVKWHPGPAEDKTLELKVRPFYVDGRLREFTVGTVHEVTDRLFVVQRAFRLNDALPQDSGGPQWLWQKGGWLVIDRITGRISLLALPDFDAYSSLVSWYRDYAAYCGLSEDGQHAYAVVVEIGRRKPLVRQVVAGQTSDGDPGCPVPSWQRPDRVTFHANQDFTYSIRHGLAEPAIEEENDSE